MQKRFKKVICSNHRWVVGLSVAAALMVGASAAPNPVKTKKSPSAPSAKATPVAKLRSSLLEMPLAFELNRGQTDAKVKFLTRAQNFTVFLMPGETVLRGRNDDVLRLKLQNANQSPKIEGEDRQVKVTNYYIGNDRSKWLHGVPNFGQVRYRDVYSGIDMVYHSDQRQMEYDFVVKPGADPNQIRVAFEGASKIGITEQGDLKLESVAGTSVHHKPVVYQTIDGKRKLVPGEFALVNNTVGFKIGDYDRRQPLVIDPTLQVLSFFGGTMNDEAAGVATTAVVPPVNTAGVVFVGRTESALLPGQIVNGSKSVGTNWDAFATGLNGGVPGVPESAGTTILWTTYLGGTGDDAARGVAMDNQANVYIAGYTNSQNFAAVGGVAVAYDAFIVKLNALGGAILAGTLYGGPGVDQATSIALDYSTFSNLGNALSITNPATDPQVTPNVVIGGMTTGGIGQAGSPSATIGKTPDGATTSFRACTDVVNPGGCGNTDGFVATFTSALGLLHATYIGGGGNDQVNGVAADIWGNIYATGLATPNVSPKFPIVNGIANTNFRPNWDAALAPQNAATAFVAKWACTTGASAIGVPSPPFGTPTGTSWPGSQFPICGGTNNLGTLSNTALFGGSAAGGTFINPQQTVLGQNGVTDVALGIAVDQNGWGQEGVAGVSTVLDSAGFPDLVPPEPNAACNTNAIGFNGFNAPWCAVTASNSSGSGGFQPGLSGPHVYIVGTTASRNFANSVVLNASCTVAPFTSGTAVPALCPTPFVFGAAVTATGLLPGRDFCDNLGGLSTCPTGPSMLPLQDLRIKPVANGNNSGQTQGWLAAFQFPAITQVVAQPPLTTSTTTVTTLNPPTIPNYIVLQPATCPSTGSGAAACIEGGANVNTAVFAAATAPTANFGCTTALGNGGVSCPSAFIGSWNAVTVDSDEQVYVIGQMGMSGATPAQFGTGAPNHLALEIERISPYINTPGGTGFLQPNFCPGRVGWLPGQPVGVNYPCAFPMEQFPTAGFLGTDFLVDAGVVPTAAQAPMNSNFGQILPGAPPYPNASQPGGLGNGIAVNPLREAFFVGTSTVASPAPTAAAQTATATASVAGGGVNFITITASGTGYLTLPTCTVTGGGGSGAVCSLAAGLAAGDIALSTTGQLVAGPACTAAAAPGVHACGALPGAVAPFACNSCVTNGGLVGSYTSIPTVTLSAPPSIGNALGFLATSAIAASILPVPPTQGNLGSTGGVNAGEMCATAAPGTPCAGNGPEDVLFGAIQFYDAIASLTAVNFEATVASTPSSTTFNSIIGPNGLTGANAKQFIQYTDWQGDLLNIPPGCTITPNVPPGSPNQVIGPDGTNHAFTVTPVFGASNYFQVTVNSSATNLGPLAVPGVVTSLVTFTKNGNCAGLDSPGTGIPGTANVESWDPLTLTLSVSAPMNLSPENTFQISSKLASGIVDQYFAAGLQLVADAFVSTGIDVSTSNSNGPINFTAQIVPGQNWAGNVANAVIVPLPTDIIYEAGAQGNVETRVPVGINTQVLASLPQGVYTAWIMFTATPETPVLPTAGSFACGPATIPVASGTTSAACVPIVITITSNQVADIPAGLVFGAITTPQQTAVSISNPTAAPYTFTGGYQATPTFGSALPAANFSFVGTITGCPSSIGVTVTGTVAAGGICSLPVQVNPAGLATGVYSGQILLSNTGQASGATAQTTVPIIVYVGPHAGEDTPQNGGLGLMLPVNVLPIGTGASQGAAPGTPGSYPLTLSVPSGTGPTGSNQIPNPTLIQVTGLNNTNPTSFAVKAPTTSGLVAGSVTFTNVGAGFGSAPGNCGSTYGSLASLPASPFGPPCVWSLWVDATTLNSTNTTALAACGGGLGETGTIKFADNGNFPFSALVVPLTVCVTDSPSLILGMPSTYPNPTFGPNTGTGFGTCNGGNPDCLLAQPSNLIPGFPLSVVDMVLAASGGGTLGSTAAPINLLATAGNSQQVCKILDLRTNGSFVNNVTIAPTGVQWLTVQPLSNVTGGAVFLGPNMTAGAAPDSLRFNSVGPGNTVFNGGITGLGNAIPIPTSAQYAAGPVNINPDMQTFAICANTDPVGNVTGTFSDTVTINGAGVGPITIPVNMVISNASGGGTTTGTATEFSQIGVYRPINALPNNPMAFYLDSNGNNAWDATDKVRLFGVTGIPGTTINDTPVAGDWDGTGVVRFGVFHCPASAAIGPCTWFIDMNNNGQWDGTFGGDAIWANFGLAGDIPVVGDWTGDGKSKIGVVRCTHDGNPCVWYLDMGNKHTFDPATVGILFLGAAGDMPAVGSWQTSPTTPAMQIGVVHCPTVGASCTWTVDSIGKTGSANPTPIDVRATAITAGTFTAAGGFQGGDVAVMGNWNGNGKLRMGIFRSSTGQWYVDTNGNGVYDPGVDQVFAFGLAPGANPGGVADQPIVGFWTMP